MATQLRDELVYGVRQPCCRFGRRKHGLRTPDAPIHARFGVGLVLLGAVVGVFLTVSSVHAQHLPRGAKPETVEPDPSYFTIARLKYPGGGDWYWGSSALPNLLNYIAENTNISVNKEEVRVEISSDRLFNYPFLWATGHGNIHFSDEEIERLRRYLLGGGFLFINDSYGLNPAVQREVKRLFPDRPFVELPFAHPIYHCWFDLPNGLPKIHEHDRKPPQGFAVLDGDRVILFYAYESDIGDGWEDQQVHNDPPEKREAALRMGVNLACYVLTR